MQTSVLCRVISRVLLLIALCQPTATVWAGADPPSQAPGKNGPSGLSFAYRATNGQVEAPYLDLATHLNQPVQLHGDPGGALWVVEGEGSRVLKFLNGTHLLTIGKAGVHRYGEDALFAPQDVATAPDGHLWIADGARVAEFDAAGNFVRNLPATGFDTPGDTAGRFTNAASVAFDAQGHLYVADSVLNRVQVFQWQANTAPAYQATITGVTQPMQVEAQPNGTLLILHPKGLRRCIYTQPATWNCDTYLARLERFWGAAFDLQGNILLLKDSEYGTQLPVEVYRCSNTIAPQCSLFFTTNQRATALAVTASETLFTAATQQHIVEAYSPAGDWRAVAYGTPNRPLLSDEDHLYAPLVKIDPWGNRYVLEQRGCRLRKYAPDGQLRWTYGEPGTCASVSNQFVHPSDLDFAADGTILVADQWRVLLFDPLDGMLIFRIGGDSYEPAGPFFEISAAAVNRASGQVYIADRAAAGRGVSVYTLHGQFLRQMLPISANCDPESHARVCQPSAIAVDPSNGDVYIADAQKQAILKFDAQDHFLYRIAGKGHHAVQQIDDLVVDGAGRLYAADSALKRVQVFDDTGAYLATIGGLTGSGPGAFQQPSGVTIDGQGNVLVSDASNATWQFYQRGLAGWQQVNINGFGSPGNTGIVALESDSSTLYALARSALDASVWRSEDGVDWEIQVTFAALPPVPPDQNAAIKAFDGALYAAYGRAVYQSGETLWQQALGTSSSGAWFGEMIVYQDSLYVAENRPASSGGLHIWRLDRSGHKETSVTGGNGSVNNRAVTSFGVFEDQLYAAVENPVDGAEIWRLDSPAHTWERLSRAGISISGAACQRFGSLQAFQNRLYLAADCTGGTRLLATQNGSAWAASPMPFLTTGSALAMLTVQNRQLIAGVRTSHGVQVYGSGDGMGWQAMVEDGFGEPAASIHNGAALVFQEHLLLGTDNPAKGGQIWRQIDATNIDVNWPVFLPILRR